MFSCIFLVYLVMRLHAGQISDETQSELWARSALDILSCGAPVLIPRLAFNVMSENMLFVSLRAMMVDFTTLTALAVWCFAGFLLSLKWLHAGAHKAVTIGEWMIWIWFGLDGTGIDESPEFHWILGPVLMVLFAFLGNTLFLTVLVSMLTNTFSGIVANAVQEIQFRRAVLTFEGVKSDAIFAYVPPFNILALVFVLPLKWILSERMFHKVNVFAVRAINLPTLLIVAWYERRTLWMSDKRKSAKSKRIDWKNPNGPRATHAQYWAISRFSVHGDIHAVFDIEPPQSVLDRIAEEDDLNHNQDMGIMTSTQLTDHLEQFSQARRESQAIDPNRRVSINPRSKKKRRRESRIDDVARGTSKVGAEGVGGDSTKKAEPGRKDPRIYGTMRRKESKTDEDLRKEFQDSSDAQDEANEGHPTSHRRLKKPARMDSISNELDAEHRLLDATERLRKMEEAMERMEAMLSQLVGGDASSENTEGREELAQELRTSSIQ